MAKMNKEPMNVTISAEAKNWVVERGASGEFGSASNVVESAIWYLKGAREKADELKYEACQKEIQKLKDECERNRDVLLKILTNHPELINEANDTKE
jgi:Arc/MetJ-type ribon-helix-helix transcriptional regulator